MATPQTAAPIFLKIARTIPAPREKVFRAWTDAEALKKWFAPSEKYVTRIPHFDARAGGTYRIEMELEGKVYTVGGSFREVKPPERLVFTWRWENEPDRGDAGDTLVTIEFFERDGSTEVVLTHEKFPSDAARDEHNKGWTGCFDRLGQYVS
jgi:uncharacterized protein YndB with AHSA1/START domain